MKAKTESCIRSPRGFTSQTSNSYGVDTSACFALWESEITNFDEINDKLTGLFETWVEENGRVFAWRGVVDARWPLHSSHIASSLDEQRRTDSRGGRVEGRGRSTRERPPLHNGSRGCLSVLSQLATLQHFGAPTRLIDVTLNAYIGLWFAVQPAFTNATPRDDPQIAGRLFALDITDRLINEREANRDWEDELHRPVERPERGLPAGVVQPSRSGFTLLSLAGAA